MAIALKQFIVSSLLVTALVGCQSETVADTNKEFDTKTKSNSSTPITDEQTVAQVSNISNDAQPVAESIAEPVMQQTLLQQAQRIQQALANKDYESITDDIHPTKGVLFSMYAFVQPNSDKVFTQAQYEQYLKDSKIRFTWGQLDGTGEILIVPLPEFLENHLQASRFNNSSPLLNPSKSRGNIPNNIDNIYAKADFVEFYVEGQEKYGFMDWRAMRLVFEEYQGENYLVAIVSDQWTT